MGYDTAPRQKTIGSIYQSPDLATACQRLRGTGVDFLQVGNSEQQSGHFRLVTGLFPGEFVRVYSDNHVSYYDVKASCASNEPATPAGP